MNRFTLIGRLTKEPELRSTQNNTSVAIVNLAVNRDYKDKEGNYVTDFFQIKSFNKLAETINKYCKKGDKMLFEGIITNHNYEKDGQKIYSIEFNANKIEFLSSTSGQVSSQQSIENNSKVETDPYEDMGKAIELQDSDLPF